MKTLLLAMLLLPAAYCSAQCQNGQCGNEAGPMVPVRRPGRPPVAEPANPAPRDGLEQKILAGEVGPQECADGSCNRPLLGRTTTKPGPQGPQGPQGPAGPPGANAEPCKCDHSALNARLTLIEKQNTELNLLLVELRNSLNNRPAEKQVAFDVEIQNPDGTVAQRTTIVPGDPEHGTVKLRRKPQVVK